MAEIEVTPEMIEAGLRAWFEPPRVMPSDTSALVAAIYRAMRALESARSRLTTTTELQREQFGLPPIEERGEGL